MRELVAAGSTALALRSADDAPLNVRPAMNSSKRAMAAPPNAKRPGVQMPMRALLLNASTSALSASALCRAANSSSCSSCGGAFSPNFSTAWRPNHTHAAFSWTRLLNCFAAALTLPTTPTTLFAKLLGLASPFSSPTSTEAAPPTARDSSSRRIFATPSSRPDGVSASDAICFPIR